MRCVLASLLLLTRLAAADELPAPTRVTAALVAGRAHLVATWHLRAAAGTHSYNLELPEHGVATTARVVIGGESHELTLLERERAQQTLARTWHQPRNRPRAGAILIGGDDAILDVELLMPATADVELTIEVEAPTCFNSDVRYALVPAAWPLTTIQPFAAGACSKAQSWGEHGQHWLALPTREVAALPTDRIAVTAGALVTGDRQLARVELALAQELAPVPADLHTVFVIDRSRSLDAAMRQSEARLLTSYGELVPASQLAVVAFDREARVIAPWGTAGTVAPALGAQLERGELANGSELLRGIGVAGDLLRHVAGTKRVIVLTDDLFATRLSATALAGGAHLVPASTVVHTVLLGGNGALARIDTIDLAPLAAATEGEAFASGGAGTQDATMLVRPLQLDHVKLALTDPVAGWRRLEGEEFQLTQLAAGRGVTWWAAGHTTPRTPSFVRVEGLLWNRTWQATLPLTRADKDIARAVLEGVSDTAARAAVQELAAVVDAHWSLYARWGGDGGYRDDGAEEGGVEGGVCGCDLVGDIGGLIPPPPPPAGPEPTLERQLRAAIARCPLDGASGTVHVETTNDEIVDVTATLRGERRGAHSCIVDAIWAARVQVPGTPRHDAISFELIAPARPAAPHPRAPAASR